MSVATVLLLSLALGLALLVLQRLHIAQLDRRIREHQAALEAQLGQPLAAAMRRAKALHVEGLGTDRGRS